jgi:hypothetical protein
MSTPVVAEVVRQPVEKLTTMSSSVRTLTRRMSSSAVMIGFETTRKWQWD